MQNMSLTKVSMWLVFVGLSMLVQQPAYAQFDLRLLDRLSESQKNELLQEFGRRKGEGERESQLPTTLQAEEAEHSTPQWLSLDEVAPPDRVTGLRPFGYELFAGGATRFTPNTNIPVPVDYVLGPGDQIKLQFFGKESAVYELTVNRDGALQLPDLGSIGVIGLKFDDLRHQITKLIASKKIGVSVNVTMGDLRSISVMVLGDARQPGSYTVSSLSTISNVLFVAGGIKTIGSLRSVQLKRRGQLVNELDLYDLMLKGDTSSDQRLQPGDVIFVPPVGGTVSVDGSVNRPARYELKDENSSLEQIISMAGGLESSSWAGHVSIVRVTPDGRHELHSVSMIDIGKKFEIMDGDQISVSAALDRVDNHVELKGFVERNGRYAWYEGMRIADLIPDPTYLKERADLEFALVLGTDGDTERYTVRYANPQRAYKKPNSSDNILLEPRDVVYFFPKIDGQADSVSSLQASSKLVPDDFDNQVVEGARDELGQKLALAELGVRQSVIGESNSAPLSARSDVMSRLVTELEGQATLHNPAQIARIVGAVRYPGNYPLSTPKTTVTDLVRAAGGFKDHAYSHDIEITRLTTVGDDGDAELNTKKIKSAAISNGKDANDEMWLNPGDVVTVRYKPGVLSRREAEILGEVKFPGVYQIYDGETLLDLLERAGGMTSAAYPFSAVFTREQLKLKERVQVDRLTKRLKQDLATASLSAIKLEDNSSDALLAAQRLLVDIDSMEAVGRLVIDLPRMINGKQRPVPLEAGDVLIIPPEPNEVTVVGEVQFPTSHIFDKRYDRDDYIDQSGGATALADQSQIYVVRTNGQVVVKRGWFSPAPKIGPGDTIIVPIDATPIEPLTLFSTVTQIVYQLGLAAASFKVVGAF